MFVIFLVTFVNLLGFGLLTPLLPFYVERVGGGPEIITLVIALYSLLQFLLAPTIGRLSDKYGRKPVLAWTMAAAMLSHLLLAFADTLTMVILARMVGGIAAANVGVAFAYVSDVSSGAERAKAMGILGAAFSMGFMFGPMIGGLLAGPDVETANFMAPALAGAVMAAIAWLCVLIILPESLAPEYRSEAGGAPPVSMGTQVRTAFANTTFAELAIMAFLLYVAWSALLSIFALWTNKILGLGPRDIGLVFLWSGGVGAVCQLLLIGPITKRVSDSTLVMLTIGGMALGFLSLAISTSVAMVLFAMTLLSAAHSMFTPVSSSLVSKQAGPRERGVLLSVFQAVGSLGRVAGPTYAGFAYAQLGPASPYWIGTLLMVPSLLLAVAVVRRPAAVEAP